MALSPSGNVVVEMDLRYADVGMFQITPERIREISREHMISSGPGQDERWMPSSEELGNIIDMVNTAVDRGQIIDFGYWPNEMIQVSAGRAGKLYNQGALGHPFSTPWIFLHTWDDKSNPDMEARVARMQRLDVAVPESAAYLINPFPSGNDLCIDFEVLAFDGVTIKGKRLLTINDRAILHGQQCKGKDAYIAQIIPYAYRFPELAGDAEFTRTITGNRTSSLMEAASANVIDPTMTALMLLNTNGIEQRIISQDKLNRIRQKQGKPHIPSYRKVDSQGYVTALLAKRHRSRNDLGGSHASPVMHIRQGHWRQYKTGERSFVRDTIVNANDTLKEMFKTNRSHYTVKK